MDEKETFVVEYYRRYEIEAADKNEAFKKGWKEFTYDIDTTPRDKICELFNACDENGKEW